MNRLIALCGLLGLGLSGCGGDGLASLEGTVYVNGEPAPAGISLAFSPLEKGSPSYAKTDESGHYVASFTFRKEGIMPGKHRVKLMPGSSTGGQAMPEIGPDGKPVPSSDSGPVSFPRDYYQEITTITVEPGSNEIDIQLETASRKGGS